MFKLLFDKLKNNRIAFNAGWIIACKLCKAALTLLSTMIVSRYLGAEKYGIISYVGSLVVFVTPIMQLGINEILIHEIILNPDEEGKTIGTTMALNLCSGVLCAVSLVCVVSIIDCNERETILVCACYSAQLIAQAIEMIFYWFQAKLKAKHTSIAILLSHVVVVLFQIVLVITKAGIYLFAFSHALEYLLIALVLLFLYKREKAQRLTFSFAKAKHLLNSGKYYIVSGLMVTIFSQTDKIMLKLMCDATTVGLYSAAVSCSRMASFIYIAIIDSFRPAIFNCKNDASLFEHRLISLYSIIIWSSLLQCALVTIAAPLIVWVLYGAQYAASANVLRLVTWFITFSYVGTVRNIWILANGHQKYLWWINVLGAIMNIFLNALLIPHWGAYGAAFASIVTQFYTNFIVGYMIAPIRPNNALIVKSMNPKTVIGMLKGM